MWRVPSGLGSAGVWGTRPGHQGRGRWAWPYWGGASGSARWAGLGDLGQGQVKAEPDEGGASGRGQVGLDSVVWGGARTKGGGVQD